MMDRAQMGLGAAVTRFKRVGPTSALFPVEHMHPCISMWDLQYPQSRGWLCMCVCGEYSLQG